ncbi:helix-turn-helix domain-containing protein [Actinomadura opuntiae]|uniref:helix-turn-helix domain-containing protein n=1 Tax=Actinomadura sp. OS1-43 TaxID=604315 RepID=UPI00255A9D10|nr:helix-turn-helix transcriptional regulator [Actinomadura sp. OS1-43]MDL4820611.1 helix-turn-helix transcriptional regulator [Actinomadura sp. OS1-43]
MSSGDQFSYRRRKIGNALRRYRDERGLTQEAAARLVERSPASLSAYENGHRAIRPRDLRQILDHYGVTDERERARLLDLAAQGRKPGWWRDFDVPKTPFIVDFVSLEGEASRIRSFESTAVPGLLQTPAYTAAVFAAYDSIRTEPHRKKAVEFRLRRQHILDKPTLRASWVVAEAVLRMLVGGPSVMNGQLTKILAVAEESRHDLRVMPLCAGAHPGMDGSFTILDVGAEVPLQVVATHSLTRSWLIDEPARIAEYERVHTELTSRALSESDSCDLIREIASQL